MNPFRRKKKPPGKEERRLPENAERRKQYDAQKKQEAQVTLAEAQATTARTAARISTLKGVARIIELGKE